MKIKLNPILEDLYRKRQPKIDEDTILETVINYTKIFGAEFDTEEISWCIAHYTSLGETVRGQCYKCGLVGDRVRGANDDCPHCGYGGPYTEIR